MRGPRSGRRAAGGPGEGEGLPNETPAISVIVPALDEADALPACLRSARAEGAEVIVADGGSRDDTAAVAGRLGARVVRAGGGRGRQMNAAAGVARGRVLLFLHADTILPPGYAAEVADTLARPDVAAGAFRLRYDGPSVMRLVAAGANLRSRLLDLPYGDQALFLPRDRFRQLGGYRESGLMEDYDLVRRLRAAGRVRLARSAVRTSARKYHASGIARTVVRHQAMLLRWHLGGIDAGTRTHAAAPLRGVRPMAGAAPAGPDVV